MHAFLPWVRAIARGMALLGGLVLTVLVCLTCVSILGRTLNTLGHADWLEGALPSVAAWLVGTGVGPILGDYELIEAGMAFAIFAFLPICQLRSEHAVVDIFTRPMSGRVNKALIAFWEVVLAIVIIVIGWRLFIGMTEKLGNGQTTFLLQFPIWWAYAASFAAAFVAMVVGVYCAVARLVEAKTGVDILEGADR